MRTKILKFGMPLIALLLAVVFAFANDVEDKDALVTGYIFSNNDCNVVSHDCNPDVGDLCTILSGETVYRTKSGTQCSKPMLRL